MDGKSRRGFAAGRGAAAGDRQARQRLASGQVSVVVPRQEQEVLRAGASDWEGPGQMTLTSCQPSTFGLSKAVCRI